MIPFWRVRQCPSRSYRSLPGRQLPFPFPFQPQSSYQLCVSGHIGSLAVSSTLKQELALAFSWLEWVPPLERWKARLDHSFLWYVRCWLGRGAQSPREGRENTAWILGWQLPIAVREARALLHTLESVGEIIANSRVDCLIDNKVVVSCWEHQLSQMPALSSVMKDFFSLTLKFNLALKTLFVPSKENPADFPSRSLSDADCKLSSLAWKLVALIRWTWGLVLQCSVWF